jgi:hypothetical protein
MTGRPATISIILSLFLLVSCLAGCHHGPDGRRVFLQSESALDVVRSFRMHVETYGALPRVTDAEFACDQDVIRYVTVQGMSNTPSLKVEKIQTAKYLFARSLAPDATDWQRTGRQFLPAGVCARLKSPEVQSYLTTHLFSAEEAHSLPPFFSFANEQGATITHDGDEAVGGVPCEIWTIREGDNVANPPQTVWIAVGDRLPRKYLQGERENPLAVVSYSDYGKTIQIQLPPSDVGY